MRASLDQRNRPANIPGREEGLVPAGIDLTGLFSPCLVPSGVSSLRHLAFSSRSLNDRRAASIVFFIPGSMAGWPLSVNVMREMAPPIIPEKRR